MDRIEHVGFHVKRLTSGYNIGGRAVQCCRHLNLVPRPRHARGKCQVCSRRAISQLRFVGQVRRLKFALGRVSGLLKIISHSRTGYHSVCSFAVLGVRSVRHGVRSLGEVRQVLVSLGREYPRGGSVCRYPVVRALVGGWRIGRG